jgi:regulator of protease activity HflC (stomatin/prohibitin superfamily)
MIATRIGAYQMEKQQRQFIPGMGVLVLATFLLGIVGALLHDFREVGFGVAGGLLWGGAVFVTFVLGTAYVSRRLLPLQSNLGWSEGFRLLWRNYTRGAANLLYGRERGKPSSPTVKKKKSAAPTKSPSFDLIGAGYLASHEAAAIKAGNAYRRAGGPGLVILQRGESVAQVIDLRPQSRKMSVHAITRDGIPVETSVSVTFQVRRPSPTQRRPRSVEADVLPYPYDRDALFDLYYSSSIADDEKRNWTEQVCPQAATLLISEIGKYALDDLLVSAAAEPLGEIKERIKTALQEQQGEDEMQTLSKGIDIVGVGIGPLELPAEVTAKRLSTWQVDWRNKVDQETASGAIEAQQLYQQARANVQVENIKNLLLSIEGMRRQSGVEPYEAFIKQVIEVVESVSSSRALRPVASRVALTALASEITEEMRQALENDGD